MPGALKSATLAYALITDGQQQWTGSFDVRLQDQAKPVSGLQANLTITNGVPTAGGLGLVGNVPVPFVNGLFINQLGATLQWVPVALEGEGSFSGTIHVEAKGMAACPGTARGFKWIFGQTPKLQPEGHCSTAGF